MEENPSKFKQMMAEQEAQQPAKEEVKNEEE
jgi:hypothetical protein